MAQELSIKENALAKAGATRELAYRTYVEATKATITRYDKYGEFLGEEPDHSTRVRAADSISRLNGDLKEEVGVAGNINVVINIGASALKELVDLVRDVNDQLSRNDGKQSGAIIDAEVVNG